MQTVSSGYCQPWKTGHAEYTQWAGLDCGWCLTAMEVEEEEEVEEVMVMLCAVQSSRRNSTSRST